MEIPRTSPCLGITIVGGSDTPLRCVVVQEVFPEGLVASDGRLQPGDQIIEVNGIDMTCASHAQVIFGAFCKEKKGERGKLFAALPSPHDIQAF